MFETLTALPPDPILGLTEAFRDDSNPHKINLGAGVYQDESGRTPVLACVKEAEKRLYADEGTKSYLPIDGLAAYSRKVRRLLFGTGHELADSPRAFTVQAPGGTGALRVAGDFLRENRPAGAVWLSDPTWANHRPVFAAVGLETRSYDYFDRGTNGLAFEALEESLGTVRSGDTVLLHACCHNPTGVDPSPEQWRRIGELLAERGAMPLLDFAYQGFARDIEEDAAGLRQLAAAVPELIVCSSFSKTLGLYGERVGALTVVTPSQDAAGATLTRVKAVIRCNYSNPPKHGAAVAATVLGDEALTALWHQELAAMRDRIRDMRRLFADGLTARGIHLAAEGNEFIVRQNGMFSFCHLSPEQVQTLRKRYSIYMVDSGRVNVAGMTRSNLGRLCDAIAEVVQASAA